MALNYETAGLLADPCRFDYLGSAVVVVLQRVEDVRRGGRDARVGTRDQRRGAGTQGAATPDEGVVGLGEAHEVRVSPVTGRRGGGGVLRGCVGGGGESGGRDERQGDGCRGDKASLLQHLHTLLQYRGWNVDPDGL